MANTCKPYRILILFLLISFGTTAQPKFEWAKQMGSKLTQTGNIDIGRSIALDKSGNVYTTGVFWDKANFDMPPGSYYLTSAGASDVFISKMRNNGDLVWAKQLAGQNYTEGNDITVDDNGNLYIVGSFEAATDFDPGSGTYSLTPKGYKDAFVCKLDSNGNFIWAKQFGGEAQAMDQCEARSVAVDASGNVYTTGLILYGKADFDPGAGNYLLTTAGDFDIFISKLDSNGNFVWANRIGGNKRDVSSKIVSDEKGNICLTGTYTGSVDFDPGAGTLILSTPHPLVTNLFISRYKSDGTLAWANGFASVNGGSNGIIGYGIALDRQGYVYTTGKYFGTVDFDPGAGISEITSVGASSDAFIVKHDSSGNFIWAKSIGGKSIVTVSYSIAVTDSRVCITGSFGGKAGAATDFDPGSGTYYLFCNAGTSNNSENIFVDQLDTDGNFICAGQMGGPTYVVINRGYGIAADDSSGMYITGVFIGNADFDPDSLSSYNLTTSNSQYDKDIFVCKLTGKGVALPPLPIANFESPDTVICENGCINFVNQSTDGDSWEWKFDGATQPNSSEESPQNVCYSSSGEYTVTLIAVNENGRDTLKKESYIKVINRPDAGTITSVKDTVCLNSPAVLSVTDNTGTIQWQSSTGGANYTDITGATNSSYVTNPSETTLYRVIAGNGICTDTSGEKKITIVPSPEAAFSFLKNELQVTFNSDSSSPDVQLWYWDFGDSTTSDIQNPIHRYSYPSVYQVCLTVYNGSDCSFTLCKDVDVNLTTSIYELQKNNWGLYPNPADKSIVISLIPGSKTAGVKLYNLFGQLMLNERISDSQLISIEGFPQGMYFVHLETGNVTAIKKLLVVH